MTVKVTITLTEQVTYSREIEMDRNEWERLTAQLDCGDRQIVRKAEERIRDMMRPDDAIDWSDIDIVVFDRTDDLPAVVES